MWRIGSVLLAGALAGCSAITAIDVCERRAPEQVVNGRTDGSQVIQGHGALARLPGNLGLLAFRSETLGPSPTVEIRGTLIDRTGARTTTCESPDEVTYQEGRSDLAIGDVRAVGPDVSGQDGAILFSDYLLGAGSSLGILSVSEQGCVRAGPTTAELVPEGSVIRHPRAVAIGNQEFVAVWVAGSPEDVALRARAFSLDRDAITFLPVVDPVTGEREFGGEAVDLVPHGLFVSALSAARGRERHTAVAWLAQEPGRDEVWLAIYDEHLGAVRTPRVIAVANAGEIREDPTIEMAFDGERYLVGWVARIGGGAPRVYAAILDATGEILVGAFRVSESTDGQEGPNVAVTALAGGGFVVAWDEVGVTSRPDGAGSTLAAVALERDGHRRFTNPACAVGSFQLFRRAGEADQSTPALTTLDDGTVVAVWVDHAPSELDPSGTSLGSTALSPADLLPVK